MHVRLACVVLAALAATSTLGCVGLLGLDHGIPEEADASDHGSAADGATSPEDSSRGEGAAPDVGDDRAVDDVLASGTTDAKATPDGQGGSDATREPDATPGLDAGCRAALQPCQHNGDCCSGACAATLTCL